MHKIDLGWEPALINQRIQDSQDSISKLQHLAEKQISEESKQLDYHVVSPYVLRKDALQLEEAHDYWGALKQQEKCLTLLQIFNAIDPQWESNLVEQRSKEAQLQIDQLIKLIIQSESANENKGSKPVQ